MNNLIRNHVMAPPIPQFKATASKIVPVNGKRFDLTQAVPNFKTFDKIRNLLIADLENPDLSFYTDVPGLQSLREIVAAWHPLREGLKASNVMITSGANHAMYTVLTTDFNIGDNIGIIEPYYFNYDMAVTMLGLKAKYFKAPSERGFQLFADEIIEWAKQEAVKGILLVTPNNPTGVCYKASEILKLVKWASANEVKVVVDETYIAFDDNHLNQFDLAQYIGNCLSIVGSFSKCFSLTGYRVGYLITGGASFADAEKVQDTLAICSSHIGQRAAIHGLTHCAEDVKQKVSEMEQLATVLKEQCSTLKHFKLRSVGAYFAFIEHPYDGLNAEQAALRLYEETGILSMPGTIFGSGQDKFLRFAFCNVSKDQLVQAFDALRVAESSLN